MTTTATLPIETERVIRRFVPEIIEPFMMPADAVRAVFVDCETSGLNAETDKIIQLALVPFYFTPDGRVVSVGEAIVRLEDPGIPIPPEITRLTGIADADVALQAFNDAEIIALVESAGLLVAHNAEFDRQFLERRFPIFETLRFACSMRDVPWQDEGYTGFKLEWLAYAHCRLFYDAHRADLDCQMGVHLLSTALPSGRLALSCVLDAARTTWVRLWATGAPFETRHILKARGYRWNDGTDGSPKAWYRDVTELELGAEQRWLMDEAFARPQTARFNARKRFSNRIGR